MPVLDRLAAWLGYERSSKTTAVERAPSWLLDDAGAQRWSIPDGSLYQNQADLYRLLSWVQTAVSAVATIGAGTAFSVKRRGPPDDTGRETLRDLPNHPFEGLLGHPNPLDSRFELLETTVSYRLLTGNAYWWLNRAGPDAEPREIWPVPPYQIQPIPDGQSYLKGYAFSPWGFFGNITVTNPPYRLDLHEIVHFKSFNPNSRFVGLSPIEALATVAETDLKAQQYNRNFFAEENGKVPGALAFHDLINDTDWEQIKADIRQQHGGVRRQLMLLRGVGQGGVNWVQMGLSQADMEFLAARSFTKEEIYNIFAPGLASVLDVNATEANATTGKASLIEFGVWPLLVAMAEKISNDILPVYDPRLRGDRSPHSLSGIFDDIRPTDRDLELREQAAAESVLTIDEIRQRYYNLGPLPGGGGQRLLNDRLIGAPESPAQPPFDGERNESLNGAKAVLLPYEQQLYDALADLIGNEQISVTALQQALQPLLESLLTSEVTAQWAALGVAVDADPPTVADWIADAVMELADEIWEYLATRGMKQDDPRLRGDDNVWTWLQRMVVHWLTYRRAWAVQKLSQWARRIRRQGLVQPLELIWETEADDRVCPICMPLHNAPESVWREQFPNGPPAHWFCRCHLRLVAAGVPTRMPPLAPRTQGEPTNGATP